MKINYETMKNVCAAPEKQFQNLGVVADTVDGPLIYIDNGSPILGIAHLDSVEDSFHFHVNRIGGDTWVFCPTLDDRLGVYILLYLLPSLGIATDILLTTGEETGKSTAKHFKPPRKYNWMYQFDRKEDDAVHYQYSTKPWLKALKKSGYKDVSYGQASDISKMSHVGCEGVNIGCGYTDYHTIWARANMSQTTQQVKRFQSLYEKYWDVHFPHTPYSPPTSLYSADLGRWIKGRWVENKDLPKCKDCKKIVEVDAFFTNLCHDCAKNYEQCLYCENGYPEGELVEGACPTCYPKQQNNTEFLTEKKCPGCQMRMSRMEIDQWGLCRFCHRDGIPDAGMYG